MKNYLPVALIILSTVFYSCGKDDDSSDNNDQNVTIGPTFSGLDYFRGQIGNDNYSVSIDSNNYFNRVDGYNSRSEELSTVRFGGSFIFSDITYKQISVYFVTSFADTSLLLNDFFSQGNKPYSNTNPFTRSSDFHDVFSVGADKPFFYSRNHDNGHIPSEIYNGLVVELTINGKRWFTNKDFSTDSRNTFEILKYEPIRDHAEPTGNGMYNMPSGRVRIKFDCYLNEVASNNQIRLSNAEFQGVIKGY